MEQKPLKPIPIQVNLTAKAREIVEGIRDDTGVPSTVAVERILEWFTAFDRKFRLAVLNRDEVTKNELARLALREMAGIDDAAPDLVGPPLTFDECERVIRKMLDRMSHLQLQSDTALGHALKPKKK